MGAAPVGFSLRVRRGAPDGDAPISGDVNGDRAADSRIRFGRLHALDGAPGGDFLL